MAIQKNYTDAAYRQDVTIPINTAASSAIKLTGYRRLAVQTPAAWTAANIGFEVSEDGTTFIPLRDAAGAKLAITGVITNAAGVYVAPVDTLAAGPYPYLRLTSLDTVDASAENQLAARTLKVIALS